MLRSKLLKIKIPDITNLATNASISAKVNKVTDQTTSITNLAITAILNAKTNDVKGEIPNITNLTSNTALTAVENKIANVSNLFKNCL